jgi:uroporphyrinogen decarboxylase
VQAALRKVRKELPSHQALLGFAGAPWTLLAYGIEGKGSKNWTRAKAFLHHEPVLARKWLDRIADVSAHLLNLHIKAGAQGVQLFDTWAGELDREDFTTFALPAAQRTLSQVEGAPRLYFPRGILPQCLDQLSCEGFAVSWQVPMAEARKLFPTKVLQGNLDPTALLAGPEVACRKAKAIVETMKGQAHVFNLGHGLLPETDPAVLGAVIDAVKAPN